eukprot:Rmarinus@m.4127
MSAPPNQENSVPPTQPLDGTDNGRDSEYNVKMFAGQTFGNVRIPVDCFSSVFFQQLRTYGFDKSNTTERKMRLSRYAMRVKFDDLKTLFHLPREMIVRELYICPTLFKKMCRQVNVHRWPFRAVRTLLKRIMQARRRLLATRAESTRAYITQEIQLCEHQLERIYRGESNVNPLVTVPRGKKTGALAVDRERGLSVGLPSTAGLPTSATPGLGSSAASSTAPTAMAHTGAVPQFTGIIPGPGQVPLSAAPFALPAFLLPPSAAASVAAAAVAAGGTVPHPGMSSLVTGIPGFLPNPHLVNPAVIAAHQAAVRHVGTIPTVALPMPGSRAHAGHPGVMGTIGVTAPADSTAGDDVHAQQGIGQAPPPHSHASQAVHQHLQQHQHLHSHASGQQPEAIEAVQHGPEKSAEGEPGSDKDRSAAVASTHMDFGGDPARLVGSPGKSEPHDAGQLKSFSDSGTPAATAEVPTSVGLSHPTHPPASVPANPHSHPHATGPTGGVPAQGGLVQGAEVPAGIQTGLPASVPKATELNNAGLSPVAPMGIGAGVVGGLRGIRPHPDVQARPGAQAPQAWEILAQLASVKREEESATTTVAALHNDNTKTLPPGQQPSHDQSQTLLAQLHQGHFQALPAHSHPHAHAQALHAAMAHHPSLTQTQLQQLHQLQQHLQQQHQLHHHHHHPMASHAPPHTHPHHAPPHAPHAPHAPPHPQQPHPPTHVHPGHPPAQSPTSNAADSSNDGDVGVGVGVNVDVNMGVDGNHGLPSTGVPQQDEPDLQFKTGSVLGGVPDSTTQESPSSHAPAHANHQTTDTQM